MWCFLHILWYWPELYIKSLTWNWRTYEGHIHGNLIPSKSVSYLGFCCIMYHPRTKSGALFPKLYAILFLNFLMAVHTLQFMLDSMRRSISWQNHITFNLHRRDSHLSSSDPVPIYLNHQCFRRTVNLVKTS